MRIDTEQLPQRLKRGLAPLYVVFGDELLLALEAADRVRAAAAAAGFEERKLLFADAAFDWSELRDAGRSLSLFASKRVIDLRIPGGKPGKDGGEALAEYAAALPEDTLTLVSLPALDWQQMKSRWFTALEGAGLAVHAQAVTRDRLPHWIAGRFAQQNQNASDETLAFIADRVEGNLMAAHQEVQKLALLLPPGEVPFDAVRDAVLDVARFDVFELGGTILRGDRLHFARVLNGLRGEGVAPPLVLWAIVEEARAMARVKGLLDQRMALAQAMRDARVWGARQQSMPAALKRLSRAQLLGALSRAAEIDRMIKGLARGDAWDALLGLGLSLIPAVSAHERQAIDGRIPRKA
ncbi:MAG: DNA polymerase III subunit delta [Burkholderiales bacterium]